MDLIKKIKYASKSTGSIMIESHLTRRATAVHRKPIFKNGKVYVRYFKCLYEVFEGKELFSERNWEHKIYKFKIKRPGHNWN